MLFAIADKIFIVISLSCTLIGRIKHFIRNLKFLLNIRVFKTGVGWFLNFKKMFINSLHGKHRVKNRQRYRAENSNGPINGHIA